MSNAARIALVLSFTLLGCGSNTPDSTTPVVTEKIEDTEEKTSAGITFAITPDDAEVIVDGEPIGFASDVVAGGQIDLAPGLHQIMIRHEDYETHRLEVTIGEGTELFEINLQARTGDQE